MARVKKMNRGTFLTFLKEMMPCHIPCNVSFTLLYIANFFNRTCSMASAATAQMAVTSHPSHEKRWKKESKLVPVFAKKFVKTLIWKRKVSPVMINISNESIALSVTTVPNDLGKETLSYRFNTAQRANSPILGITKLEA